MAFISHRQFQFIVLCFLKNNLGEYAQRDSLPNKPLSVCISPPVLRERFRESPTERYDHGVGLSKMGSEADTQANGGIPEPRNSDHITVYSSVIRSPSQGAFVPLPQVVAMSCPQYLPDTENNIFLTTGLKC